MTKTSTTTVARTLVQLIARHVEEHDKDLPQFAGMTDGSEADVATVELAGKHQGMVELMLSDGTGFLITVSPIMAKVGVGRAGLGR